MHSRNDSLRPYVNGEASGLLRLKKAAQDLDRAVAEQRAQVAELQGNLKALDRALGRVEGSFRRLSD